MNLLSVVKPMAVCALALALAPPTAAKAQDVQAAEKAASARQHFMQLVSWEIGPLFGMAKNPDTYDAAVAAQAAADVKALASWDYPGAFVEGSSKADLPGKTRTLPAAFEDRAALVKTFGELRAAVDTLAAQAGDGPEALGAAVGEVGKVCGACHNTFRAKEF